MLIHTQKLPNSLLFSLLLLLSPTFKRTGFHRYIYNVHETYATILLYNDVI